MLIFLFAKRKLEKKKYGVSLCLIFKDEAPFLKEWFDYHKMIGVDHFYLYNNNSTDNYLDVLQPYIEEGVVTLIDWPHQAAQMAAYKNFYDNYRSESNWISFLDADEFICLKSKDTILDWLADYSKYPAIVVNWLIFGTGGQLEHDYNKNVIEQYFSCWDHLHEYGKCFINTRYDIANFDSCHLHHHTKMYFRILGIKIIIPAVNQFKYICPVYHLVGGGKDNKKAASIYVNHYFTKAWDIYSKKRKMSDVYYVENPRKDYSHFYKFEDKCITTDFTIQRFFIKLKINQNIIS